MCEAIRTFARYETLDEKGETRRERNERFLKESPEFFVNGNGLYLWHWYHETAACVGRVDNNTCRPIPPSEWLAWAQLTGNIVRPSEYAILLAMDEVYCAVMNEEYKAYHQRMNPPSDNPSPVPTRKRK